MRLGSNKAIRSKGIDRITLSLYLSLLILGWLMLYAVLYDENDPFAFLSPSTSIGKQSIWVLISLIVLTCTLVVDWKFWNTFAYPIYIASMVSLILVLFIGKEVKGATSWFNIGGMSFQPSEIAKFATALALSAFTSYYKSKIESANTLIVSLCIIGLPMGLILLQGDAGTAIVFTSFFLLLYRKGLSGLVFIIGFSLSLIFICSLVFDPLIVTIDVILIGLLILLFNLGKKLRIVLLTVSGIIFMTFLFYSINPYFAVALSSFTLIVYLFIFIKNRKFRIATLVGFGVSISVLFGLGSSYAVNNLLEPHQLDRINVWLRPELADPQRSFYNIRQSMTAIGSGGLEGKGFLQGQMTKLNYVPEQSTDFIFSTVGEEQGFIGSFGIILLFTMLLIRITVIAERAKSPFVHNYAYCVAGIFFIHIFINIAMTMNLMPVIGIPLPFLSKGGTALVGFTLLIGTLIKMDLDK